MAHTRNRHILSLLKKQGAFWPIVGLLGLRQSGKSTIFRDLLKAGEYVSFDDRNTLEDATNSEKNFLLKLPRPLIIDEVQKVPGIFDALKLLVDQEKRPGSYFVTGSSQFSSKIGIRESLTGRIGINYLYPLTLAEAHQLPFEAKRASPIHNLKSRFTIKDAFDQFFCGGLPVPLFTRDRSNIRNYFQSWMETTVLRDVMRAFGAGYNSDIAYSILERLAFILGEGEYASLKHFKQPSRLLRKYLHAFEDVFLIQKIPPHDEATGSDIWTFSDTGIYSHFCKDILGEGIELSMARIFAIKEIKALCEYSENRTRFTYFKTARSAPVDLVWNQAIVKISHLPMKRIEYDLRPTRSAMNHLKINRALVLTAVEKTEIQKEKKQQITVAPWTHFS